MSSSSKHSFTGILYEKEDWIKIFIIIFNLVRFIAANLSLKIFLEILKIDKE